jgi:hypothetical protein
MILHLLHLCHITLCMVCSLLQWHAGACIAQPGTLGVVDWACNAQPCSARYCSSGSACWRADCFQLAYAFLMMAVMQLLANHFLVGEQDLAAIRNIAEDGAGWGTVTTLLGEELIVTHVDNQVVLQSSEPTAKPALVIHANYKTCAGVLHIIDSVLIPAAFIPEPATELALLDPETLQR